MKKSSNRVSVIDFVISVLIGHEKELNKSLAKLQHITRKLENNIHRKTS